jgi:hypothetical protein
VTIVFDDLASLFYHNVVSAYDQYVAIRDGNTSGRSRHTHTALEAAAALFHFREHLPRQYARTRAQVVAECPDYRLVADVANATKHRTLDNDTSEGPPLVKSAEDIEEITIITRYEDEQGEYTDARTLVFINCNDGVRRNLDTALTNVLNYWGSELKRLDIVNYVPRSAPEPPGTRLVPRSEARAHNKEIVQGLRFKQTLQLMTFDASKGCAIPIDLTGAKLKYRIYKPRYSVDITVKSPGLDEPIRCSIDLTEEQSLAVTALTTDAERTSYINSIIVEHRKEISDAMAASLEARTKARGEGQS